MSGDELDDTFAAIVADLDDLTESVDAESESATPVMDVFLGARIRDGFIEVHNHLPDVAMLTGFLGAVRAAGNHDLVSFVPVDDPDDPVTASLDAHGDEWASSVDRALEAAADLLSEGIPLTACFDAARGLHHLRVQLCDDDTIRTGDPDADELIEHLLVLASVLAEELMVLALDPPV